MQLLRQAVRTVQQVAPRRVVGHGRRLAPLVRGQRGEHVLGRDQVAQLDVDRGDRCALGVPQRLERGSGEVAFGAERAQQVVGHAQYEVAGEAGLAAARRAEHDQRRAQRGNVFSRECVGAVAWLGFLIGLAGVVLTCRFFGDLALNAIDDALKLGLVQAVRFGAVSLIDTDIELHRNLRRDFHPEFTTLFADPPFDDLDVEHAHGQSQVSRQRHIHVAQVQLPVARAESGTLGHVGQRDLGPRLVEQPAQIQLVLVVQVDYTQAHQRYEQSLAIKRTLGDQHGIASSLHNLGMLHQAQGDLGGAVQHLARAYHLFEQLGAPERTQAARALSRLREQLGNTTFEAALTAALGGVNEAHTMMARVRDADAADATRVAQSGDTDIKASLTQAHIAEVIVTNTLTVRTVAQDKRGEWWQALEDLRQQAPAGRDTDLAQLCALAQQVVEGTSPESLTDAVPAPFKDVWQRLTQRLQSGQTG